MKHFRDIPLEIQNEVIRISIFNLKIILKRRRQEHIILPF